MPRYRVYYNQAHAWPYVWSVDDGDQAHEHTCEAVVMCDCYWQTRALSPHERLQVDPETTPTAWIEVEARAMERVGNKVVFVAPTPLDYRTLREDPDEPTG
jgi:hypothetical protein